MAHDARTLRCSRCRASRGGRRQCRDTRVPVAVDRAGSRRSALHPGEGSHFAGRGAISSSARLLGWTTISGRGFYVRQMKNICGSIPVEWLHGATFDFYAWCLGLLLARAHARTGDAALITGYCGSSDRLDAAYARWAESYGAQTVVDHAAFVAAIAPARVIPPPPDKAYHTARTD